MKSVNPKKYNKNYWGIFKQPNYASYHPRLANKKFREINSLIKIKKTDFIVDLGCGQGDMCFYLSAKYNCQIIGIDYSKDAINLANKHLKDFRTKYKSANIKFYNLNNQHLPNLKNVKYVFLNDVIEHLYCQELKLMFNKIKDWGNNTRIAIHTDNNIYIRFIRPFTDIIGKCIGSFDKNYFSSRKNIEKLHVNLTNPYQLKKFMSNLKYKQIKLDYPQVDIKTINNQLGFKKNNPISFLIKFFLNLFRPLSPSFYAIYIKIN